ncbi:glutamate-1-semialdehyde 2,1-aminomutase [Clostridium sp. D2Q-14]|uniref:glutamate-1-semialdehyde 2,1-aminomutase n=1 Tax=Anaeromonas gelatinilytica TaxID=2683194 RepID=UPI00193BB93B|nr:glutamate-1-semialdehyde 2,1-aminomutase [Anaeromonas gelatinilytica]MBS4535475.1 glutamate-1-semialdehyde 2,1-aminomutase [Anaeromonas gelatinilytica]
MNTSKSKEIYEKSKIYIPGGVNSPVRAFNSVGIDPIFINRGTGSKVYDEDGNEYIDFICSWGPLIFGHSNEDILSDVDEIIKRGTSYGMPTEIEYKMAKLITQMSPSVEMVRMVNSGTEATMSAIRLARGYTRRDKIIKFEGCYHGHSDSLLVKTGSGALTFSIPTSPGVTEGTTKDTLVCTYNDLDSVKKVFEEKGDEIAAIIVEPVAGNMGVVPPTKGFLQGLREITKEYGAILIFDEVITGFRLSSGGAQKYYGVTSDLTCYGKIIGGGLPVGAYGGKKEIMNMVSPVGPVYQAGTLSGNPLAMYIGYKTLKRLQDNDEIYKSLEGKAIYLEQGLNKIIDEVGIEATVNRAGVMLSMFFSEGPIEKYEEVMKCDTERYGMFFKEMISRGILLAPSQYEGIFISEAHTIEHLDKMLRATRESLNIIKNN